MVLIFVSYLCIQFLSLWYRHRPSSHDVSSPKSRRIELPVKNGDNLDDCSTRSPVVRFRNESHNHRVSDGRRHRSRIFNQSLASSRSNARRPNEVGGHSTPGHTDVHSDHSSLRRGRKRHRRSKERVKRQESHNDHKQTKEEAVVPIGDIIKRRFEVRKVLGEGSFGQVLECLDRHTQSVVAVKALKRLEDYDDAAKHEVDILDLISKSNRSFRSNCIDTVDFFDWHRHFYIVFPLLSISIFNFLEDNEYEPYPIEQAASITRQLCDAVQFMQGLKMCHTDLKPENVMFCCSDYDEVYSHDRGRHVRIIRDTRIKVIDFGSAVLEWEKHPTTIQTRHYRAPEVVLECGWSYPADVWSLGCILYELVTGQCLFMTHDNLEHLAMMDRVLGPMPRYIVKKSRKRRYFYRDRLDWDIHSSDGRFVRQTLRPLGDTWMSQTDVKHRLAFDLVKEMLCYEPESRISAKKSTEHPFLLA